MLNQPKRFPAVTKTHSSSETGESLSSLIQVQNTAMRLIQFMCLGKLSDKKIAGPLGHHRKSALTHIRNQTNGVDIF